MEIITGYTGENHVTSADDASLYRGILGTGDYVLDVGNKFAATIIDNNTVRIMDGDLVIQGHQARIRANDYEEVTIDNGTPGQKRNDLIVARYQKNTITGIESISLAVVKGTPGPTAVDPETVQEDLKTGGTQRDFALYRVSLDGLVLESVTSLFSTIPNLKAFKTHLAESASKHIKESGQNENGKYIKFDDGTMICHSTPEHIYDISTTESTMQGNDLTTYRAGLTITYPATFSDVPSAAFVGQLSGSLAGAGAVYGTRVFSPTNVSCGMQFVSLVNFNTIGYFQYIAIGRWKA